MHLLTFRDALQLSFTKSAGSVTSTCEPGKAYVFSDTHMDNLMRDKNVNQRVVKISNITNRLPNFHVGARKAGTQRLLFYNGSGGYGDQIMSWPVARLLAHAGFEVHILADPGNQSCWWGFPWVKSVHVLPIAYEIMVMYDYFVIFDHVVNLDEHPGQEHPTDAMLRKIGIDPVSVDPSAKCVRPILSNADYEHTQQFSGTDYGIYQLTAANPTRSLPAADSAFMLRKLAESYPDLRWVVAVDSYIPQDYIHAAKDALAMSNVQIWDNDDLRGFWSVVEGAKVCVGPDSMLVHAAGSMGVPCIGLWGLTDPTCRVSYYDNHYAVWPKDACPMAPCFAYGAQFPAYCPPRPGRNICDVMASISHQDVVDLVAEIVYKNSNDSDHRETDHDRGGSGQEPGTDSPGGGDEVQAP